MGGIFPLCSLKLSLTDNSIAFISWICAVIEADECRTLLNIDGQTMGKKVYFSVTNSVENWQEITDEETAEMEEVAVQE